MFSDCKGMYFSCFLRKKLEYLFFSQWSVRRSKGGGWAEPKNGHKACFGAWSWRCEYSEHGKSQLFVIKIINQNNYVYKYFPQKHPYILKISIYVNHSSVSAKNIPVHILTLKYFCVHFIR